MALDTDGSGFFNRREFERALHALGLIFFIFFILVTYTYLTHHLLVNNKLLVIFM